MTLAYLEIDSPVGRLRLAGDDDSLHVLAFMNPLCCASYALASGYNPRVGRKPVNLVLQRAAGGAEAWRPWRAYAAMHLWQGVKDDAGIP